MNLNEDKFAREVKLTMLSHKLDDKLSEIERTNTNDRVKSLLKDVRDTLKEISETLKS